MIIYAQLPSNPSVLLNLANGQLEIHEEIPPLPNPSSITVLYKKTKIFNKFAKMHATTPKNLKRTIVKRHQAIVTYLVYPVSIRKICTSIPSISYLWVITDKQIIYFKVENPKKLPAIIVRRAIFGRNYAICF